VVSESDFAGVIAHGNLGASCFSMIAYLEILEWGRYSSWVEVYYAV
jgi:hypothetical protein